MANEYYLVRSDALPEVLLKVAQAKQMLETGEVSSIQEAVHLLNISRSSFYKYKDSIEPLADGGRPRSITISCICKDQPGVLSQVLEIIFRAQMNIQTIFQSVPVGGVAQVSIHAQYMTSGLPLEELLASIKKVKGVATVKLLAQEE